MKGKYPRIFDDPQLGETARKLFDDANELLDRIINEKLLTARGVYGFWPAASQGDDIIVYTDESRSKELHRFHTLRQQWERKGQNDVSLTGRLRRSRRKRPKGLHRRLRRHGRHRRRRACQELRQPARRLQLDSRQKPWPIAWPKHLPNTCTPKSAAIGAIGRDERLRAKT